MPELAKRNPGAAILNLAKRAARKILRKLFRIQGHESFTRNAYKAPVRYARGILRHFSAARRKARRTIVNTRWPADQPMVTVIIPCYNYGHYVKEALQSVLNSTWQDLEVIVVEGGSTDGTTPDVVRSLEGGKVRCLYQPKRCYECENRFFGLQHAQGKYILFLDADDMIDPTYIENAVYLMETTGVDVIVPDVRLFSNAEELKAALERHEGKVWNAPGLVVPRIFEENSAPGTTMFRHGFWKDNNIGMNLTNSYAPDWDFWMRLTSYNARFIHLGEPYHIYRLHNNNITLHFNDATKIAHMDMVRKRFEHIRLDAKRLQEIRYCQAQRPKVRNPFVNLAERPSGFERGELNVLIAVPWLDNYGNSVLLGNIFKRLKQAGVQATVVGTNPETDPIFLNGVNNYLSFTRDCFYLATCLPEGDPADFLAHIVRSRKIDVLMINGSKLAYESLERLRRENPRLRIVDHLYNTVGHIEANRAHDKLIDFNIVANDEVRKHLIDLGEAENRVKIVHHGIDVEEFKPAPTPRIPRANGEPLTFGFLGRLSEEKRPEYVVEMARRFPEFRFVIAGAGVLRDRLEASIREARAASRVQLVGSVPSAQEFYNSVDAILLPSRIEGLPLVLLEAMAFEKPVVAARVGMIGEVIESGRNGFTFPAGDLDAMASALEQISKMSSADLSALGQKARATVTEHFSLRRCADEYLNAFRQVALSSVN